ncbi:hypothetical protein N9Z67_02290 [Rhodopirellula sp.]|nr:hypothetical protein [bacterium]MDB4394162.1 hypothetical protein [Rhodopirellula sp.]MDB4445886.1 hypothetical protein [bacterium]
MFRHFFTLSQKEKLHAFLASWIAALTLFIGLTSAQQAEAGGFRARAQLNPATPGAGFNPVDFYALDMPLYLGLMDLGLSEEEALALSWGGGWDWDEDFVTGSWNWDEDFVEKANPNDSPGP